VTETASAKEVLVNSLDELGYLLTFQTYPPQNPEVIKAKYFHLPAAIDVASDGSSQTDR
jgi:hypothetical protein